MTEILQVFLQFFVFIFLFSFPFNIKRANYFFGSYNFSFFDVLSINLIFHLTLFLFISFFYINLYYYFLLVISLAIIFFLFDNKKNLNKRIKIFKDKLIFFFSFITIILFFYISQNLQLHWDGQAIWVYKAINFFNEGSFADLKNFNTNMYPHLGGFLWGFFWKNSFLQYEYLGRLSYVFIYCLSIFSIISVFKISVIYKSVLSSIIIFLTFDSYLFGGYQEYLLFSLLILISKYLNIFYQNNKNFNLLLLILFAGNLLIWFKNEGMFYYLFISLILILDDYKNYKKILLISFFYFIPIIFKLYIFNKFFGSYSLGQSGAFTNIFEQILTYDFELIFLRLYMTTMHVFVAIFKYPIWIIILVGFFTILIDKKYNKKFNFMFIFLFLNIMFVYGIFFITRSPLEWHLAVSLDRLMFQTSGFYIILILEIINNKYFLNKKLN